MCKTVQDEISKTLKMGSDFLEFYQKGIERLQAKDLEFSERYIANMSHFEKVMPHIYENFKDYTPTNKYVYLEESGDLNLIDKEAGCSIFNSNPKELARERVSNYLKKPKTSSLTIARNQAHFSKHVQYCNKMSEILHSEQEKNQELLETPAYVPAMLMFGLELGYQLEVLLDSITVKHLYIYERNSDFFYYSLFSIDWISIFDKFNADGHTLNFLIGVEPENLLDKYLIQLEENGYFWAPKTYLYTAHRSELNLKAMNEFAETFPRQAMGWGFFDDALMGIAQGLVPQTNRRIAAVPVENKKDLPRWIQDTPVFIVGNGPSLDNAIDLIKEHRESIIVICCGSTINTLNRVGIKPDFQVDVERMKQTVDKFEFLNSDYLKDIVGLTVDVMHPNFYQYFDKVVMGGKPGEAIATLIGAEVANVGFHYANMNSSGPFVANLALSYCSLFGFNNLYFSGVDNGYKDSGSHHSKYSGYYKDGKETGFQSFKNRRGLLKLIGNFGDLIYSTNEMNLSRVQLGSLLKTLNKRKNFSCFNLSDGAKIEGAKALDIDDVLILDEEIDRDVLMKTLFDIRTIPEPDSIRSKTANESLHMSDCLKVITSLYTSWESQYKSREEVCQMLWRCHRSIYFLKATQHRYIYDLMKGSFTYAAFYMLSALYSIEDEVSSVNAAEAIFSIWQEFLDEMPSMLEKAADTIDEGNEHLKNYYNG